MKKIFHILVADDEVRVRQVLRDMISALGKEYIIYTAADSREALHLLSSLPLDLALVDIYMPTGEDGFELIKKMRAHNPHLMIVVITGEPKYERVLEALRLGVTDFLAKPISLTDLRKILTTLKEKDQRRDAVQVPREPSVPVEPEKALPPGGQHFLRSLGEKLAEIRSPNELYAFLTDMAISLSGGTWAKFYLYDQEHGRMQLVSQSGTPPGRSGADISQRQETASCFSFPLKIRGELLGILHVYRPPKQRFEAEVMNRLHLLAERFLLTLENLTLQESVFTNLYDTLLALINSLEARDPSTRHHSVRVTSIAAKFAEKIGLSRPLVDSLRRAGALHDIGKIGIPDAILLKPAALTPEEMEIIRQHPVIGEHIIAPLHLLPRERDIILHHHERWDGKGYPSGLAGADIPLLARIVALADSYDAIISDRPYRRRRSHEEALAEIAAHAGSQFDPELTEQFIEVMSRPLIKEEMESIEAELDASGQLLPEHQFQQLLRNFSHRFILRENRRNSSAAIRN